MTDEEAKAIINEHLLEWVGWDDEKDQPDWRMNEDGDYPFAPSVVLDGNFTLQLLQAIIHFAPLEKQHE